MIGVIIGDIVGSPYEWDNIKRKDFELFDAAESVPTDDTVMSLAIAKALLESKVDYSDLEDKVVTYMQKLGRLYPDAGYSGYFYQWINRRYPKAYNSFGNGSAMRVSACGYVADTLEQAKELAGTVSSVTHNHPEGIKGAEAIAVAIFMALHGSSKAEIKNCINSNYYDIDFTLDDIRETYTFDETCQGSVPQALEAFFESTDFEDAIRNAISIGGDSDTIGAITGSLAEAYYGVPESIRIQAMSFLDEYQKSILNEFESKYPGKVEKTS